MAWSPNPQDTAAIAAIRWFAATLETLGNDVYLTDRSKYGEITDVLKGAVEDLNAVRMTLSGGFSDCPPGYVDCNGVCEPMCLNEVALASAERAVKRSGQASKKRRQGRRR